MAIKPSKRGLTEPTRFDSSFHALKETNLDFFGTKFSVYFLRYLIVMMFTKIIYFFSFIIQLREEFDRGGQITLSMETGVHDVATLLKEFFRDLPEPLLPKEVQSALLAIHSKLAIPNFKDKLG